MASRPGALVLGAVLWASGPSTATPAEAPGARPGAERFDHPGSICAVVAPGVAWTTSTSAVVVPQAGARWSALLGGGLAIDDAGRELLLLGRASGRGRDVDAAALLGLRGYFGDERIRTFFDLQVAVEVWPALSAGPRFGAGLQYELTPVAGAFCAGWVQLGFGPALTFATDFSCGLQLRSYLLQ